MYGIPIAEDTPERTIAFNQAGRLTPAQIKRMQATILSPRLSFVFIWALLLIGPSGIDEINTIGAQLGVVFSPILRVAWFILIFCGFALLIVPLVISVRLQIRFFREVRKGVVVATEGTLQWRGQRYVAEAGDLHLIVPPSLAVDWYPGPYRLYYLPVSHVLAAAEWLGEPAPFGVWYWRHPIFDQASLPFNRERRRSPIQLDGNGPRAWLLVPLIVLILLVTLASIFADAPNNLYLHLAQVLLYLLSFLTFTNPQFFTDLRPGQMSAVEDVAHREARQKRTGSWEYLVWLHGVRLKVSKLQYDALAEPYRYRAYYPAHGRTHRLLNAEPIGEIPASSDLLEP